MITKFLSKTISLFLVGGALVISSGCGGGGKSGSAVDAAQVSQLEAKVKTGDAAAAFKIAELYAADGSNRESAIEAAKWFNVAGRLGNGDAKAGLDAISSGMPDEDKMEVQRRVAAFPFPAAK